MLRLVYTAIQWLKSGNSPVTRAANGSLNFSHFINRDIVVCVALILYCTVITLIARDFTRPDCLSNYNFHQKTPVTAPIPFDLHYVWVENRKSLFPHDLTALQYLSILSAVHFLVPNSISLHTNVGFTGPLWNAVKNVVTVSAISPLNSSQNSHAVHIQHMADLNKLEIAYENGGMFVDFDIYFVGNRQKYFDLFQGRIECVSTVFHTFNRTFFAIGNFACKKRSLFIKKILQEYQENFRGYKCYTPSDPIPFLYNGCLYPYHLYENNADFQKKVKFAPDLLIMFPRKDLFLQQSGRINWRDAFNVHSGYEGPEISLSQIWTMDSSYGQVLRHVMKKGSVSSQNSGFHHRCEIGGKMMVFQYESDQSLDGVPDLTTLQFLSVLSAIQILKDITIRIETKKPLTGPFWSFLVDKAELAGICLDTSPAIGLSGPSPSSTIHLTFNVFLLKPHPPFIKQNFQTCFFDANGSLCDGVRQNSIGLALNGKDLRKNRTVSINWTAYDFIRIENLREPQRLTLENIRKLKGPFGQLFRLIYYGVSGAIRDVYLQRRLCNTGS